MRFDANMRLIMSRIALNSLTLTANDDEDDDEIHVGNFIIARDNKLVLLRPNKCTYARLEQVFVFSCSRDKRHSTPSRVG